jgi:hypothetical protein
MLMQVIELDVQYRQCVHAQQLHARFYGQAISFGKLSLHISKSELHCLLPRHSGLTFASLFQNRWPRRLPSLLAQHVP